MYLTITPPEATLPVTAVGNTRSECHNVSLPYDLYYRQDWLKVVGYCDSFNELEALIMKYFNCEFDWSSSRPHKHGRKIYPQSARTPNGIIFAYEYLEDLVYKVLIDISATPLMELSEECAWKFSKELYGMGLRCTRFDFAIDDYARVLSFDAIKLAGEVGNFARVRTMRPHILYTSGQAAIVTGYSCGSRESDRYLRIYDKEIESRGKDCYADCIRVEGEFKSDQAEQLFEKYVLAETVEEALSLAAKYVVGIVDFVEKSDVHLDRCEVLSWWASFVSAVGGSIRVRTTRLVRTVDTIVGFVERQVKRGLALLQICQGDIWFRGALEGWLSDAKKKFGHTERKFIERHNNLVAIYPDLSLPLY